MRASSLGTFGLPLAAAAWIVLGLSPARGADTDAEAHLRDQLRSATIALRDAQDQNAALSAKQKELGAELDAARAELEQLKSKPAPAADQDQLAAAEATAKQDQDELQQSRALLEKWQAAYKQAAEIARSRDAAAKDFEARFTRASGGLDQCADKNAKLGALAEELLDRLDHHSFVDDLIADEPVTKLDRVKLENLLQDYEDKIRDQKVIR